MPRRSVPKGLVPNMGKGCLYMCYAFTTKSVADHAPACSAGTAQGGGASVTAREPIGEVG